MFCLWLNGCLIVGDVALFQEDSNWDSGSEMTSHKKEADSNSLGFSPEIDTVVAVNKVNRANATNPTDVTCIVLRNVTNNIDKLMYAVLNKRLLSQILFELHV